jgi:ABC-type uncharacterized transport system substrate-binding protein
MDPAPLLRAAHKDLVINLTAAKVLGLTIPPSSLLSRADEVIQYVLGAWPK